jgi:hypothetical protein
MAEEELDAIPRRSAREVLADTNRNGVSGEATIAAAMNEEWWRGYYAGLAQNRPHETAER